MPENMLFHQGGNIRTKGSQVMTRTSLVEICVSNFEESIARKVLPLEGQQFSPAHASDQSEDKQRFLSMSTYGCKKLANLRHAQWLNFKSLFPGR